MDEATERAADPSTTEENGEADQALRGWSRGLGWGWRHGRGWGWRRHLGRWGWGGWAAVPWVPACAWDPVWGWICPFI